MKFKSLSKNNDAVETVIAVILMVAITVILAAAIGATVFSQGPEKPAEVTKIMIDPVSASDGTNSAVVKLTHEYGPAVDFTSPDITRVTISVNNGNSTDVDATSLKTMKPGDTRNLPVNSSTNIRGGCTANIKVVDARSGRVICDSDMQF